MRGPALAAPARAAATDRRGRRLLAELPGAADDARLGFTADLTAESETRLGASVDDRRRLSTEWRNIFASCGEWLVLGRG